MPASTLAIETRALQKVYYSGFWRRPFTGLDGLDLQVPRGEIFGFIGPNGAGKTTAIKCLVGLQSPTGGEAFLFGRPVHEAEARRRLGYLPERAYFYQHLTAVEFLDFYGQLFELPREVRRARIPALLARVGLERAASTPLRLFSKGMLQRAGVAQALINEPDLVILDEPMSGLDPLGRMVIRDIMLELCAQGRTVFFSSHILSDVQSICHRVGLIVGGRLRAVGAVGDLLSAQVTHMDCTVRVPVGAVLPGELIAVHGEERILRIQPEALDPLIDRVRAVGGTLLQVQPIRRSLEDLLVDEVSRPNGDTLPAGRPEARP